MLIWIIITVIIGKNTRTVPSGKYLNMYICNTHQSPIHPHIHSLLFNQIINYIFLLSNTVLKYLIIQKKLSMFTLEPEATISSSVDIATVVTTWSCPYSIWTGRSCLFSWPSWLMSHTTHVQSQEPLTRYQLHWSNATHVTKSEKLHLAYNCATQTQVLYGRI